MSPATQGASADDAASWSGELVSRSGLKFHVRPVRPADEPALRLFFDNVTPEDLRFRFLTTLKRVGHDRLRAMIDVDHRRSETFIASVQVDGPIIAVAMLACDEAMEIGEVAITLSPAFKSKGFGWELLRHISRFAEANGIKMLQSLESRSNHAAIQLEQDFGFTAQTYPGDSTLVLVQKQLSA
ncbi:MAG: GNAT family N-acetyltransferase [Devosia sp.]